MKRITPFWLMPIAVRLMGFVQGKWPQALAEINLSRAAIPESLTGKILYKMAKDRNPRLTVFADKLKVREYVHERVGESYLNTLIAHSDSTEFLKSLSLPSNFALKSNNGSGGMILVWEGAPKSNRLPTRSRDIWGHHLISPERFELDLAEKIANKWLSSNYFYAPGRFPEWAYKNIKPMLLLEELMIDEEGELPSDYKFFMIDGRCAFIQVDTSRFDGHKRNLFTPAWEKIEGTYLYPASAREIDRPKFFVEMLKVAQKLSEGVDFIRVDLYETSDGVKFGELTNYPGGGNEKFTPQSLDSELGRDWRPIY